MPKFRTKPVVIEAQQFHLDTGPLPFHDQAVCCLGPGGWYVSTLEGPLHVRDGDWIIRGVRGEFYPCPPDIFEATHESAE